MPLQLSYFQTLQCLGQGGFGTVYHVRSKRSGTDYALKEVENTSEDAMKEADLLKEVEHDHIVKYVNCFTDKGKFYIVMEYADYGTLTKRAAEIDNAEYGIWRSLCQMANAIGYLHDKNILHRDLKPDNVLGFRANTGNIVWKLADFGIAKLLEENAAGAFYASTMIGTETYMAKEVLHGTLYTFPADIWSLGAMMSYLCNRRHLFINWQQVANWAGGKSTISRVKYSIDLRQLVADMLHPESESRPTAKHIEQECYKNNRQNNQ